MPLFSKQKKLKNTGHRTPTVKCAQRHSFIKTAWRCEAGEAGPGLKQEAEKERLSKQLEVGAGGGVLHRSPITMTQDIQKPEPPPTPPLLFGGWPAKPCWNHNSVSEMPVLTEIAPLWRVCRNEATAGQCRVYYVPLTLTGEADAGRVRAPRPKKAHSSPCASVSTRRRIYRPCSLAAYCTIVFHS